MIRELHYSVELVLHSETKLPTMYLLLIAQDDGPTVPVHKALLAIVSLSLILLLLYLLIASKH